jgi:WD40 repeat protein
VESLDFTKDGELLAVGCMGRKNAQNLRLIDVDSRKVIHEADPKLGEVLSVAWSEADGERHLAIGGQHGIALWKILGSPVRTESVLNAKGGRCLAMAINRQSSLLAIAEEKHLKAWDVFTKQKLTLDAPDMIQGWHGVALLPDGQSIIYISKAGVAEVWNLRDNQRMKSLGEPGTFNAPQIALSPNGIWLAALIQLDTVSVWHAPTGTHVFSLRPETGAVWSLAWNSTSEDLAVGQTDGGLAVWHLPKIQKKLAESGLQWQVDKKER